ncbi:Hypothetical predicted protein [Octopus vulgaris]|uniref:Uncharacterized protein n=1 Tax=Octopus vulgaris TaxID=6645 RepID=A0AA36F3X1_OCTVU|nr:Hypothetical predicted protein [Octopus vulgaris]
MESLSMALAMSSGLKSMSDRDKEADNSRYDIVDDGDADDDDDDFVSAVPCLMIYRKLMVPMIIDSDRVTDAVVND